MGFSHCRAARAPIAFSLSCVTFHNTASSYKKLSLVIANMLRICIIEEAGMQLMSY